jgi:hypothetical protein
MYSPHLKQVGIGLLGFLVLFGLSAVTQINPIVTITVSQDRRGALEIDVNPATVTVAAGGTVTFLNAVSSITSVTLASTPLELYREIRPGEQYAHQLKTAGEFMVTINALPESTLVKVTVTAATAVAPTPPGARPRVVMAEILLEPTSGEQLIALANLGKGNAFLTEWSLCVGPSCARLANLTIPPQSWVVAHLGVSGTNMATDVYVSLPRLNRSGDELALYSSNRFEDPASMVDYVRWGTGRSGGRLSLAVSAGLWASGDTVDVSRLLRGQVLRYDGIGRRASDYSVSAPTMVSTAGR